MKGREHKKPSRENKVLKSQLKRSTSRDGWLLMWTCGRESEMKGREHKKPSRENKVLKSQLKRSTNSTSRDGWLLKSHLGKIRYYRAN